jgi:hypothetical protein
MWSLTVFRTLTGDVMLTYRKAMGRDWAVFGPASEMHMGRVTVHRRDGTTSFEVVERISKSFDVDGVPHCFGYIRKHGNSANRSAGGGTCAECGRGGSLVEDMEDGLMKHRGCCDIPPE